MNSVLLKYYRLNKINKKIYGVLSIIYNSQCVSFDTLVPHCLQFRNIGISSLLIKVLENKKYLKKNLLNSYNIK